MASYIPAGEIVEALPSGRPAGEPLCDGHSPGRGRDMNGPTAVLKSMGKVDNAEIAGGIILNMRLDPAVAIYAKRIAGRAPLEGLDWAGGIADQELREATLARVARIWAVTDVDAAKAWVDQSNLPDWMRDKIFTGAAKAVERAAKEKAARETAAREVEQIP